MALLQLVSSSTSGTVLGLAGSALVYCLTLGIYRLYFHPLSHIPGPKLAAITYFYAFCWDIVQPAQLAWHLQDLHDQYGPVVRLTPDEVHIRDPTYFDELFARSTGKRNKLPRLSGRFGFKTDSFPTWQHDLHRMHRAAINPFFFVQKVTSLQPVIRSNLTKLTKCLAQAADSSTTIPINLAFMALTGDITTTYAFAKSYGQLDSAPTFNTTYEETLKALYVLGNLTAHYPTLFFNLVDICPPWLTQIVNPVVMPIVTFYADRERDIVNIRTGINKGHELADNPTIFHEMLRSDALPEHERSDKRLSHEAGIITTSFALTVGTYHLAANPEIQALLRAELRQHLEDPLNLTNLESNARELNWHALEPLPYLSAVCRESIRLSGGVVTRAARIAPDEPPTYKSYTIPAGSSVSMTTYHVNHDPSDLPGLRSLRPNSLAEARRLTERGDGPVDRGVRQRAETARGRQPRVGRSCTSSSPRWSGALSLSLLRARRGSVM